ncbi:UvsY [Synechococcus phage S-PM2]|uniref:UvsY n=1 Tax=Synechococcus phage S-PM2 TaxID=238854 RepID=Q5GQM7_BPSYP|nr:UvsY-like recombination mediator [Synechococcus phage S-PM2]CAF34175.1 UvsY [Synechococcus phage S-PM2]CFW42278.1 UvsY [Synechococcus phage S-PM2]
MKFENLHNRFEKIKKEWAEDSYIDIEFRNKQYTSDLGKISIEIPFQHNKYLNHYTDLSQIKTSLEFEARKLIREKREYYGGEADARVYAEKPFGNSIKTSEKMKVYLDSDEDLINIEAKIKFIDQVLFYLDNVLKMISQRNYHVKNAIEWERFINGN